MAITTVTLRAAVMLSVLACVGMRSVAWVLRELFHVETTKSSLSRWLMEAASQLPEGLVDGSPSEREKPKAEARLDEIFPRGWGRGCVPVVKDERGRVVATEEVEDREELRDLMAAGPPVAGLPRFLDKVWGIFKTSKNVFAARQRLLKVGAAGGGSARTRLEKAVSFLMDRLEDMIAFLRVPWLRRSSLRESGIRCPRRLE